MKVLYIFKQLSFHNLWLSFRRETFLHAEKYYIPRHNDVILEQTEHFWPSFQSISHTTQKVLLVRISQLMTILAVLNLQELNGIVLILILTKSHDTERSLLRVWTRKQPGLKINENYRNFKLEVSIVKGKCDRLKVRLNHSCPYLGLEVFPPPKFLIWE